MSTITQMIPTIQGEGPFAGRPSLLIRFKGCNLQCPFCDTKWTNVDSVQGEEIENNSQLRDYIHDSKYLQKYNINTLLLTGGEPFIQNKLITEAIIHWNKYPGSIQNIEIESNGIKRKDIRCVLSDTRSYNNINVHINISPKLNIDCHENKTIENILYEYKMTHNLLKQFAKENLSYCFKFIYDHNDKNNYLEYFNKIDIDKSLIYMMPLTPSRYRFKTEYEFLESFRESCRHTVEFCMNYNLRYSPREHIFVFGDNKNETI